MIPLLGFFNLSKNDILKTVHGTCFTSTLVACIPRALGFYVIEFIHIILIDTKLIDEYNTLFSPDIALFGQ